MESFGEWLELELKQRGWKQAELARRTHVQNATISRLVTGIRRVGPDMALAIARALGEPPEDVLRRAGLLPPLPEETSEGREILEIVNRQPAPVRRTLLSMLRGLAAQRPVASPLWPSVAEQRESITADVARELALVPDEWLPEILRAREMMRRNAQGLEPWIIGDEEEHERATPAPAIE